jgi:hypothetical protein
MTDFLWPTTLVPARSEVKLLDLATRFRSPFTGTSRTYARPGGDVLSMSMQMPPLRDAKRAQLVAIIAALRGGVHRVWCKDHSYVRRGSFPSVELLPDFSSAAPWTPGHATLSVSDGVGRITAETHSVSEYPGINRTGVPVTNGGAYVLRAFFTRSSTGTASLGVYMESGTAIAGYHIATGFRALSLTTSDTSAIVSVRIDGTSTSTVAGDFADVPYASLARCALVKGASQTGSKIVIDALPVSTNGLLLAGDRVQIGEELLTVIAPLDSNSSGEGTLILHRPLRTAPADNAPVIIHEPMGLFMLAEQENGWLNDPGRVSSATVNLIEAIR